MGRKWALTARGPSAASVQVGSLPAGAQSPLQPSSFQPSRGVAIVEIETAGDQVRDVRLFLEGKNDELLERLRARMKEAALQTEFERKKFALETKSGNYLGPKVFLKSIHPMACYLCKAWGMPKWQRRIRRCKPSDSALT